MKKIKLNKGLKLNKEAISKLQETQISHFRGGVKLSKNFPESCIRISCIGPPDDLKKAN
jgi:hypothetical protein